MFETTRGYATAAFDTAAGKGALARVHGELSSFGSVLAGSDALWTVLTDGAIPAMARRAIVSDLVESQASPETTAILAFVAFLEPAGETPAAVASLISLVESYEVDATAGGEAEPIAGRSAVRDRIRGYAERVFEEIGALQELDVLEEELFAFARAVEENKQLQRALGDGELPLVVRVGVVHDLLDSQVRPSTVQLVAYVLRAGRVRDVVGTLEWLVTLAAEERGRRHAEVRSAVPLDAAEQERLASALTRAAGRPVEVRATIDPSVIGGMIVTIGDTVIDGSLRHRLDRLRETVTT